MSSGGFNLRRYTENWYKLTICATSRNMLGKKTGRMSKEGTHTALSAWTPGKNNDHRIEQQELLESCQKFGEEMRQGKVKFGRHFKDEAHAILI